MEQLDGRIAVVTGGGSGIGRALVCQLAAQGCHVATCDVADQDLEVTRASAIDGAPRGTRVTTSIGDVTDDQDLAAFRDAVAAQHETDHVHLLFNNAGVAGGGSFVAGDRAEWERTFEVDWWGVYRTTRAFLPMLLASSEGHVVNLSSVSGLWATLGPGLPHTAYSAAKFAVRGFTEALICDFRVNAPHLRASVVLPGHVGTSILLNAAGMRTDPAGPRGAVAVPHARRQLASLGVPVDGLTDDELAEIVHTIASQYRDAAPLTASDAAAAILAGVRANRWRIIVGQDAVEIDEAVRADPEAAYDPAFFSSLLDRGHFTLLG